MNVNLGPLVSRLRKGVSASAPRAPQCPTSPPATADHSGGLARQRASLCRWRAVLSEKLGLFQQGADIRERFAGIVA